MKDLALGDLIKEDKEKAKLKRKAKIGRRIINKRVNSNFRRKPKFQNFNNKRRPINSRSNQVNNGNAQIKRRLPLKRRPLKKPKEIPNNGKKH